MIEAIFNDIGPFVTTPEYVMGVITGALIADIVQDVLRMRIKQLLGLEQIDAQEVTGDE